MLHERPKSVTGTTVKVTPPNEESIYLTVNVINVTGSNWRPIEVFINGKAKEGSAEAAPWMTALTRVLSALFRHEGEWRFIIDELKEVADPRGTFFHERQQWPSVVALIAYEIELIIDSYND